MKYVLDMMFIVCSAICIIHILLYERKFCLWDHGRSRASRERTVKSESENKSLKKSPESATIKNGSQYPSPRGREKKTKNEHVQNKQTNAREVCRPDASSKIEVITMLKGMKKHEFKEQGKT